MLSGWGFFKIYHSLDLHFNTPGYDVFKYSGRIKTKEQTYIERRDYHVFERYASKFSDKKKAGQFCVANFMLNDSGWLYHAYEENNEYFMKWKKTRATLNRVFEQDITKIKDVAKNNLNLFEKTPKGNNPPMWQIIKANLISAESCVIINNEMEKCFDMWSDLTSIDPYMDDKIMKLKKYTPFVQYEPQTMKTIIKERLVHHD